MITGFRPHLENTLSLLSSATTTKLIRRTSRADANPSWQLIPKIAHGDNLTQHDDSSSYTNGNQIRASFAVLRGMTIMCVFSCRHPLWGGDGICITDDSDPTVDATCSCGAGYMSRDAAGFPSCVPKVALVAGYAILGVSGLLAAVFLSFHANQYRYLLHQFRHTRRATIRIRALVSGRWVRRNAACTSCQSCGIWSYRTVNILTALLL